MTRPYRDLNVLVEKVESRYRVRILGIRDPATADFDIPDINVPEAERMRDVRVRRDETARLKDIGGTLFQSIFKGKVELAYRQALLQARNKGEGLRIRLQLTEVPELEEFPWEAIYDSTEGQFLGLMPEVSIVRFRETGALPPLKVRPPLRIVGVLASPRGEPRLAVEEEWERVESALLDLQGEGLVALEKLQPGTARNLLECLDRQPCHVLHFIGHGMFNATSGGGRILLEGSEGDAEHFDEHRLATALQRHGEVRLAVINACHGARSSPRDVHSGLSRRLLQMGIPAVIAMNARIGDRAAVDFATRFYRELASGSSIEEAFGAARHDLFLHFEDMSWTRPALSLCTTDPDLLGLSTDLRHRPFRRRIRTALILLVASLIVALAWLSNQAWNSESVESREPLREAFLQVIPQHINPEECPAPAGVDLPLVLVRASLQQRESSANESPLIVADDFCLGVFEVTQAQWESIVPNAENRSGWLGADRPVERISYLDTWLFIEALNDRTPGSPFRLPTEVEWELAARATSSARYSFGDDPQDLESYGNCISVSGQDGYDGTAPVGSFKPNDWGLYDMQGNVWEWVLPDGGDEETGVLRGGSYDVVAEKCEVSYRKLLSADERRKDYGFRVAREPVAP